MLRHSNVILGDVLLLNQLSRIILIVGHAGSGKTNLSVNLALDIQKTGRGVVLCDLDIVNPYFRSADFTAMMQAHGVETVSPTFANTNLDSPALGAGISASLGREDMTVIVDVGGDDAGAVALGRYAADIVKRPYSMLYVFNHYRLLTRDAQSAFEILNSIRAAARLECTHIVNNSNLGSETTRQVIEDSLGPCTELSRLCALPVLFTAVPRAICGQLPDGAFYPVDIHVKKPWDPNS